MSVIYIEHISHVSRYYEELECEEVDKVIMSRFEAGENMSLGDGKLLERMLTIKMLREGIPTRSYYYMNKPQRIENPTKAPFFKDLIPVAEERLKNMRLVSKI